MKKLNQYKSASDWYFDARKEGYRIPGAMIGGITVAQRKLNLSFEEVFNVFVENKIIIKVNSLYIYNLSGYLLIKKK